MKVIVISYSLTGNNEALASGIATAFQAEHIKISEPRPRTNGTIVMDLIFNRTPRVQPPPGRLEQFDMILLLGPVWMGQVATPLRAHLKYLKSNSLPYAFISISGGADGANPKLEGELKKRTGRAPAALIDLHIADLLPPDPKPTREDTSAYRLTESDVKSLTDRVMKTFEKTMTNQTQWTSSH